MLVYVRAIRAVGAAALAALLVLAVPAFASRRHRGRSARACPDANSHAGSTPRRALREAVLCLVNDERSAYGLPPLRASDELNRSAQGWSDEMVARGAFGHGSDFAGRIQADGYRWGAVGENIASGYATPLGVVSAWMRDVGHCRNILDPMYRDLGVGINPHPVRGAASGPATWTQDFGRRISQSAPSGNWRPADGCPH